MADNPAYQITLRVVSDQEIFKRTTIVVAKSPEEAEKIAQKQLFENRFSVNFEHVTTIALSPKIYQIQ